MGVSAFLSIKQGWLSVVGEGLLIVYRHDTSDEVL